MKELLFLPLFSLAMFIGLFAFAEETAYEYEAYPEEDASAWGDVVPVPVREGKNISKESTP